MNIINCRKLFDPFTSQVTLDVGSTYGDESKVRRVLERQLQIHTLGGVGVSPEGFTFRHFPGKRQTILSHDRFYSRAHDKWLDI